MPDHLETAPVIDAVRQHDSCPFCQLRAVIEQQCVERNLGGAVMEPDIRLKTNAVGFCRLHHRQLMAQKDYHSYALMMQTRLKQVRDDLTPTVRGLAAAGLFDAGRRKQARTRVTQATQRCLICEQVNNTLRRYHDIFFKLYRENGDFRSDFEAGPGFCLADLPTVLETADVRLMGKQRSDFLKTVSAQLDRTLSVAQEDLDALCSSFHYGSEQKNNPRIHQALERAVNLIRGKTFE